MKATNFNYKIDLEGKHILIIMPEFYAYQDNMMADLKARGAFVHIYNEQPPKKKFLILKNIGEILHYDGIFNGFNKKLLKQILSEMPAEKYDYFLLIRGHIINKRLIDEVKAKALKADAHTTYYSWDSFENMAHGGAIGAYFDRRATFDSEDVKNGVSADAIEKANLTKEEKQKLDYELIPLFYSDAMDGARYEKKAPDTYEYDYVSISAFFPFRYEYFKSFYKANPDKKMYLKLYLHPDVLAAKKIKEPELFNNLDMDIISTEPFSPDFIRKLCLKSRAVLDLAHEAQQGLTMRTMETLGIRRKLVTNNKYLADYEFYNENNAIIMQDLKSKSEQAKVTGDYSEFLLPSKEWLEAPYAQNEEMRAEYSIHAWIDNLFRG